jgi:superfamily II DNA helicase RecQ
LIFSFVFSVEAKQRGIKAVGKKDQILTRLLIWTRDEIANSVEPGSAENDSPPVSNASSDDEDEDNEDNDECFVIHSRNEKLIDLSDGENSYDDDSSDTDNTDGELEICHETDRAKQNNRSFDGSESTLHESLENFFGYTTFREGQEWAIRRCLSHERTLLVAPTGQGKSLCYALPAALMDGICLVVSPLISLMQDQLRQLPPKIPAATLSGSLTVAQMALIVDDIMRGRYKVLFVSPERLASAAFRRLVRPKFNVETRKYEQQFPTVSLLCVDEVS